MSPLGQVHLAASLLALVSGALVLWRPKGNARHRRIGWVYVGAMVVTNLTALGIYRLFGRFGPFHAGAIMSLVTTVIGVVATRRRAATPTQWVARHYFWMTYSYVGLAAAAVSETATRLLRPQSGAAFGAAVAAASLAVFAVGAWRIRRGAPALVARFTPTRAPVAPAPVAPVA